jgi:HEAT repeat protein
VFFSATEADTWCVASDEERLSPAQITYRAAQRGDVAFLIGALAHPELRLSSAHHLGDLRARSAVPWLVRNLRVKNDLHRNAAVKALGKIGDLSAAPALHETAETDEAAGVRVTAIDSLAMLGDPRGMKLLAALAIDPEPLLASASRNFDQPFSRSLRASTLRHTRKWAAKRLRQIGTVDAIPTLTESVDAVPLRHRIRLGRTIRVLQSTGDARP